MTLWSDLNLGGGTDTYGSVWALSQIPGQDPTRYSQYHNVGAGNGDNVADAVTNPSANKLVYAITPLGAGASKVMYCEFPLVPDTSSGSSTLDTNPSTLVVSMHPYWSPADDDLVVYRTMDDSPNQCEIRTVVPSTASITSLKTISRTLGNVIFPRFNFDGSRIAYGLDDDIWVMNADGSGATQVVSAIGADLQGGLDYAWSPVADELAYCKTNGQFRLIQGDGSGDTLLYTDGSPAWGLTLYPWSPDGSTLYYFKNDQGSAPSYSLWTIDAGGGGGAQVSPLRLSYGGINDELAYVYGERVYWYAAEFTDDGDVVSCALDGSDLRTELTSTFVPSTVPAMYAAKASSDTNLYRMGTTGGANGLGSSGARLTGLASRPSDNVLFGVTTPNDPTNPRSLFTLDPDTGAGTLIGSLGIAGPLADISFRADDTLFGFRPDTMTLYSVNTSTGAATQVSGTTVTTPPGSGMGCSFDSSDTLYAFVKPGNVPFYTVDSNTGTPTVAGTISSPITNGIVAAATFDENDVLWAIINEVGAVHLTTIDVSTGVVTDIGTIAASFDALVWGFATETPISRFTSGFYYWLNQPR